MKFRLLLLLGALSAGLASLPLHWRIAAAIFLALWLAVDLVVEELRQRRATRRAREELARGYAGPEPEAWIDCDAIYYSSLGNGAGGMRGECHERKAHGGPHAACLYVEWPQSEDARAP